MTRDAGGHLAFGVGIHYAALARLEARIAVEALLDELPHLRRTDSRVEHIDSFLIRGPQHPAVPFRIWLDELHHHPPVHLRSSVASLVRRERQAR